MRPGDTDVTVGGTREGDVADDPLDDMARQAEPHLRLEDMRAGVEDQYQRLESMRQHPGVTTEQWDAAEGQYFERLTELDTSLAVLGLERTDDLTADRWYQDAQQQERWTQQEPWGRDNDRGHER